MSTVVKQHDDDIWFRDKEIDQDNAASDDSVNTQVG